MVDQTNIFKEGETPNATPEDQSTVAAETTKSTVPDPVSAYVGEGKKYSSMEDFAKAFDAAQAHIATLESENKDFREQTQKQQSMEELLEELKQTRAPEPVPQKAPEIDINALDSIIEQKLTAKEQAALAEANTQKVVTALRDSFGDKAEEVYNSVGSQVGLSVDAMNSLAAKSPEAVLKLVGTETKTTPAPSTSTGSINTDAMQQTPTEKPSAKIPDGATGKDLAAAWDAAKPLE